MAKVTPPDFADMLAQLDKGRANQELTRRHGRVVEDITTKASAWGKWKGTVTLTLKMAADKHGGIEYKVSAQTKVEEEPIGESKMYYNPDNGALTAEEPRQLKISGIDDDPPRRVKSAEAPNRKEE